MERSTASKQNGWLQICRSHQSGSVSPRDRKGWDGGAHLAQLHDLVLQAADTGGLLRVGRSIGEDHSVLLDLLGELDLQRTHLALDDPLDLVGEVRLDVLLQSSEQERPEHLVQTTNDEQRLFFVQLDLVLATGVGEGRIEPLVEALHRAEDFREYKVEQCPQLRQVVLQVQWTVSRARCTGWSGESLTCSGVPVKMRRYLDE